jgi:hypothetical protein
MVRYRANQEGFRVRESGAQTDDRPVRIALIGDSFFWGYGVTWEESLAGQLEGMLPGCAVSLYAQPGWGLDQMLTALEDHVLPAKPDVVVVGIFPDDLDRCFDAFRVNEGFSKPVLVLDDGHLRPFEDADRPGELFRFLERYSRILAVCRRFMRYVGRNHGAGGWWELNAAILDRMVADATAAGIPILVTHVPSKDLAKLPAIRDHLTPPGIAVIDLLTEGVREDHYFPVDTHLNQEGNRFLAERVVAFLRVHAPVVFR